ASVRPVHGLPLADEIFLIGHDENTGKPLVSDATMDTALAGAVLGELVFAHRLTIADGTLVVPLSDAMTADLACEAPMGEIRRQGQQQRPGRAWVEHVRDTIRPMVGQRLVRAGLVERVEARAMLKTTLRFPFRDRIAAAAPVARLRYMLDHPADLDEETAT